MLRIVCVKVGDAYSAEYVNILCDSVCRNLPEGYPGTFECFTDDPTGILPHINIRPLPEGLTGWWAKLWMFKAGHFDDGDRILYFDLDTLILGKLDEVVEYSGDFCILRDFYRPDGWQSAVMAWPANTLTHVWDSWEHQGRPVLEGGDQEWIERVLDKADLWQDLYPKLFVSYKTGHYHHIPPKGASVVCFHGQPKPHNCHSKWVEGVWRINGTRAFEIEQIANTESEKIAANLKHAISLPHPWLERVARHDGSAVVVGGAPSLKRKYDEITRRQQEGAVIFATNNTVKVLRENGIEPDYHVLIDARPENAEFIQDKRPTLGYLLASQCDKALFDKIGTSAPITVYHPIIEGIVEAVGDDPRPVHLVGGGSTVCLKTIALAYIMGYRNFYLFGMDSSYEDGKHHAYEQALNDGEMIFDVQVDDQVFRSTPWMVAQANEFQDLITQLVRLDCTFNVAGDGLIPYIARSMIVQYAAATRAQAVLDSLPEGPLVGAEIGVFSGEMSSCLLSRENLKLLMVDAWDSAVYHEGDADFHAHVSNEQQARYRELALEMTDFAKDRRTIMAMPSVEAAKQVEDETLDFVFIDADHSYEGCSSDIAAWYPKVKPGGIFSGHDYENPDFPGWGVKTAVDEFAKLHGLQVTTGENFTWFTTKPHALEAAA